jgi:hypothetical protein
MIGSVANSANRMLARLASGWLAGNTAASKIRVVMRCHWRSPNSRVGAAPMPRSNFPEVNAVHCVRVTASDTSR